ncbi:aminoacyl-tRNA hydrolase [Patescibacteria group bacterium]|nr:aminoacyl-tRNA hydrolase [Patescibacteria group bacterium]
MPKKLIVGLGNPGADYADTRHNLGWLAVETLAKRQTSTFREERSLHTLLADTRFDHEQALLSLPITYMNESGRAVQAIAQYFKIPLTNILLVQDELDYAFGTFAFRENGSPGGHNGIASIYELTGTTQFSRLRIGIGRPVEPLTSKDYVLQKFSQIERAELSNTLERAADAIECWIREGLTKTMNLWNGSRYDTAAEPTPPVGRDRII